MAEGQEEGDLAVAAAPRGSEFMDGDFMLCIHENHILLCSSGLREGGATRYLHALLRRAGQLGRDAVFGFQRIVDPRVARSLARDGVKFIRLDVGLFGAAGERAGMDPLEHHQLREIIRPSLVGVIMSLLGRDADAEEISQAENLSAQLFLRFDSRRKGGELGMERLSTAAVNLLQDGDEGFLIKTRTGSDIRSGELALKREHEFSPFGKTVHHESNPIRK